MEYTLKFTEQEMQVLNAAIVELPFKIVAPLVKSINEQLVAAQGEVRESVSPPAPEEQ